MRVNAVAPTYIETPLTAFGINESPEMYKTWLEMTPMGRVGQPDEIASVVHFLASDAASLLTGSIVLADAATPAGNLRHVRKGSTAMFWMKRFL